MPEADMGSRKNRFAPVFGETENQVRAPRTGKTKFRALRHGATWGRGRRDVQKKQPWPVFGGTKNLAPTPRAGRTKVSGPKAWSSLLARAPVASLRNGLCLVYGGLRIRPMSRVLAERHIGPRSTEARGVWEKWPWPSVQGAKNQAQAPCAGRLKFGNGRHGSACWRGAQGVPKKTHSKNN